MLNKSQRTDVEEIREEKLRKIDNWRRNDCKDTFPKLNKMISVTIMRESTLKKKKMIIIFLLKIFQSMSNFFRQKRVYQKRINQYDYKISKIL